MANNENHIIQIGQYLNVLNYEFKKPLNKRAANVDALARYLIALNLVSGAREGINPHDTIATVKSMLSSHKILLDWFNKITTEILKFLHEYLINK